MITNATNGLAAGMMGPFVVYWFYRRFGASAAELARLFFFINILASIPYLVIEQFSRRVGLVNTVTLSRGASAVMLAFVVGGQPTRLPRPFTWHAWSLRCSLSRYGSHF
jgi:ABC-type Co2+ transport system permease subunit